MHDPDAPDDTVTHLKLSAEMDDLVADDMLSLRPADIDYLASIDGEYRLNKILRRMGATFYLSKHQQRLTNFTSVQELSWYNTMGIQEFNHRFELALSACNSLGIFSNVMDQCLLYISKLREGRHNNAILIPILNKIDVGAADNILLVMKRTASDILTHAEDGKIGIDSTPLEPVFNLTRKQTNSGGRICYFCGDKVNGIMKNHLWQCKGKRSQCTTCGGTGHLTSMCNTYHEKVKKQRPNNKPSPSPPAPDIHYTDFADLFMVQANTMVYPQLTATVDTGANCFCFRDISMFETLQLHTGEVSVIDKRCGYDGTGIARVCFQESGEQARIDVICNSALYEKEITPVHSRPSPVIQRWTKSGYGCVNRYHYSAFSTCSTAAPCNCRYYSSTVA